MIDPTRASGSTSNQIQAGQVCFNDGAEFCNQVASDPVSYSYQSVVDVQKRFAGSTTLTRSEGTVVQMLIRVRNFSSEPLTDLTVSDTFRVVAYSNCELRLLQMQVPVVVGVLRRLITPPL